jgi:hypothetical protein
LQKASVVFHSTNHVRNAIERYGLLDPAHLVQAPLGIAVEFQADPVAGERHDPIIAQLGPEPFLLHVGSCIPRKRVDVLLDVFSEVRRQRPGLKLVQSGGEWTEEHR